MKARPYGRPGLLALLVTAVVVSACEDFAVTDVTRSETGLPTLDRTPIDTTIISRSAVGDIAPLLGIGKPDAPSAPSRVAPEAGATSAYSPLETTVVLYYVIIWLYQNGYITPAVAIAELTPVIDAYTALSAGNNQGAITAFVTFVLTVNGQVSAGAVMPQIGQALNDLAVAALAQLVPLDVSLQLQVVASGLTSPLHLTAPANDARLFITTKGGTIRIVQGGQLLATPFLDIGTKVETSGERGLLSVAFDPSYATNGFFYVFYTGLTGNLTIERYTVSANPNVANPASAKPILSIAHPSMNHNGGQLLFGPDGMLYIATGDGGMGSDPTNPQNRNVLLGKLLRIDVRNGDPYAIPASNPFVGQVGARGEIWALGLRNPWRNDFDLTEGRLYVADVGENTFEEVNVVSSSTGGVNYGWRIMEGLECFNAPTCNQAGLTLPVLTYSHANGCSITGGIVYRGQMIPELSGHYFYSDYCSGWVRSFRFMNGQAAFQRSWNLPNVGNILSFGEDASGEMYLLSGNGNVYRVVRGN